MPSDIYVNMYTMYSINQLNQTKSFVKFENIHCDAKKTVDECVGPIVIVSYAFKWSFFWLERVKQMSN